MHLRSMRCGTRLIDARQPLKPRCSLEQPPSTRRCRKLNAKLLICNCRISCLSIKKTWVCLVRAPAFQLHRHFLPKEKHMAEGATGREMGAARDEFYPEADLGSEYKFQYQ